MKKYFSVMIISAAMLLSSCGENADILESSETTSAAEITTTSATEAAASTVTSATTLQTSQTASEASPMPSEIEKYYISDSFIEIPLSYEGREVYLSSACREVVEGCEYEDFPAKEDIAPAIEFAFENYFKGTNVYYMDDLGGQPCAVENLSFDSGLYFDFDSDGEKESIIAITNNSECPFTEDVTVVYTDSENGLLLLDENVDYNHRKYVSLYGLIYDDCVNFIIETVHGNTSGMALYTYDDGFNLAWANNSTYPDGVVISSMGHFSAGYPAPVRLIWNPEKKRYDGIGRDKITYEELIEKVPEAEMLCAEIERVHKNKITSIETDGGLNFCFYMGDKYVSAYVMDGVLRADIRHTDDADHVLDYKTDAERHIYDFGNDVVYGLFLTYAVPDRRVTE